MRLAPSLTPLALLFAAALLAPATHAFDEDDDDDDGDRVIYATSPQDVYEAKLSILKAQIDAQRTSCQRGDSRGQGYCQRELDQAFRDGQRELARQRDEALKAEAAK
jgi:hypothetical protein